MRTVLLEEVKRELRKLSVRRLSLLVEKGGRVLFSSPEGGLSPLLAAIERLGEEMAGSRVIDKVVGWAAAKLLVYAHVGEVFTSLASRPAVETLRTAGITLGAFQVVNQIQDSEGNPCPFETLAGQIADPRALFYELRHRLGGTKSEEQNRFQKGS